MSEQILEVLSSLVVFVFCGFVLYQLRVFFQKIQVQRFDMKIEEYRNKHDRERWEWQSLTSDQQYKIQELKMNNAFEIDKLKNQS